MALLTPEQIAEAKERALQVVNGFRRVSDQNACDALNLAETLEQRKGVWTKTPPTIPGYYWWRGRLESTETEAELVLMHSENWCDLHGTEISHTVEGT